MAGIPELGCDDENPENFKVLGRLWMGCVWELARWAIRGPPGYGMLRPQTPDLEST